MGLMRIKEQVNEKRRTVCTRRNAHSVEKTPPPNITNMLSACSDQDNSLSMVPSYVKQSSIPGILSSICIFHIYIYLGLYRGWQSKYIYSGIQSRRGVQVYIPRGFIEEGSPGVYTPGFHRGGKSRYIYPGVSSRREVQVYITRGFIKEGSPRVYNPGFHQGGKSMYIHPGVSSRREVQVYIPKGFIKEGSPGIYTPGFHQGGKSMYIYPKVSSRREVQVY